MYRKTDGPNSTISIATLRQSSQPTRSPKGSSVGDLDSRRAWFLTAILAVAWYLLATPGASAAQGLANASLRGYYEFYAGLQAFAPPAFITGRNRIRLDGRYEFPGGVGAAMASVRLTQSFVDPQEHLDFTAPKVRLWETYVDLYLSRVDIRIGQQLIVWGQADGIFITDIVSPLDLSEFLAQDFTDIRMPIPAVTASYYAGSVSLTGVLTAIPTASIVPAEGSPWFVLPDLPVPYRVTLAEDNLPGAGIENVEPAIRLGFSGIDRTEIDLIYMFGFNRIPALGRRLTGITSGVLDVEVAPTYYRRSVFGLRWSTALTDPWVLDSEVSFQTRADVEIAPFDPSGDTNPFADDLLFESRELLGLLGLERLFGDNFARTQLVGSLLTRYDQAVVRDQFHPSVTAYFRRSFRRETIFASVFAFYNLGRDAWLNPALQWSPGHGLNLYAGVQIFIGDGGSNASAVSPFTLYSGNDFVYVRLTQHF